MIKAKRRVVLITGTTSGMGRATALYLAQKGYVVYAGTRTPSKLSTLKKSDNIHVIELDITQSQSIKKAVTSKNPLIGYYDYTMLNNIRKNLKTNMKIFNINKRKIKVNEKELININTLNDFQHFIDKL